MIITKEDVGRRVMLSNGEECSIIEVNDHEAYPIVISRGNIYTVNGKYWKNQDDYTDRAIESDIVSFVADSSTTEQIKESITHKHIPFHREPLTPLTDDFAYPISTETKNKDINFTIPENTVTIELEINGYKINVSKIQE